MPNLNRSETSFEFYTYRPSLSLSLSLTPYTRKGPLVETFFRTRRIGERIGRGGARFRGPDYVSRHVASPGTEGVGRGPLEADLFTRTNTCEKWRNGGEYPGVPGRSVGQVRERNAGSTPRIRSNTQLADFPYMPRDGLGRDSWPRRGDSDKNECVTGEFPFQTAPPFSPLHPPSLHPPVFS